MLDVFSGYVYTYVTRPDVRDRVHPEGEMGVYQMRTLLLIFAFKRPKYADTGGGGLKRSNFA